MWRTDGAGRAHYPSASRRGVAPAVFSLYQSLVRAQPAARRADHGPYRDCDPARRRRAGLSTGGRGALMSAHEPATTGCPKLMPLPQTGGGPYEYGLATCTKYNTSPPRGIPEKGEET